MGIFHVLCRAIATTYHCIMAIAALHQWLYGDKDYHQGLTLYLKYGNNKRLSSLFTQRGATSYNTGKLENELRKLAGPPPADLPAAKKLRQDPPVKQIPDNRGAIGTPGTMPAISPPVRHSAPVKGIIDVENLPPELAAMNVKKGQLFSDADRLHRRLREMAGDADRLEAAIAIMNRFDEIDLIWQYLDAWQKDGTMPPVATTQVDIASMSAQDLFKRRQNLRTYITKASHRIASAENEAQKVEASRKLRELQGELKEIERRLNE